MKTPSTIGVIDIGNSGIKGSLIGSQNDPSLGPVHARYWLDDPSQSKSSPAEFFTNRSSWISIDDDGGVLECIHALRSDLTIDRPCLWRVSSVQPKGLASFRRAIKTGFPQDTVDVVEHRDIPMKFQVDEPASVGTDRLLAAWGAWYFNGQTGPLIVIQAGTAVTVDWVDESGVYGGGAIMPGISLTLKYLALGTARLPWLAPPRSMDDLSLPGRNTSEAILAGVAASFIGGIRRLQEQYRQRYLGDPLGITTVVSGGDGSLLASAIEKPFVTVDHLVLKALASLPMPG